MTCEYPMADQPLLHQTYPGSWNQSTLNRSWSIRLVRLSCGRVVGTERFQFPGLPQCSEWACSLDCDRHLDEGNCHKFSRCFGWWWLWNAFYCKWSDLWLFGTCHGCSDRSIRRFFVSWILKAPVFIHKLWTVWVVLRYRFKVSFRIRKGRWGEIQQWLCFIFTWRTIFFAVEMSWCLVAECMGVKICVYRPGKSLNPSQSFPQ